MIEYTLTGADPFSILTVVVAPAVLTNASSVLVLGTSNCLARVADRSHAVAPQLAELEPGAQGLRGLERAASRTANSCATAVTRASLLLLGSRTVRQLGPDLDRTFHRGVLRRTLDVPNSGRNWRCLWSLGGHFARLRLCPDDSRNAARSYRLSLRSKISIAEISSAPNA
jgi:hypothetical protein